MNTTAITGIGHYVPERIVTNDELAQHMETSDEWIRERTGIQQRRFFKEGEEFDSRRAALTRFFVSYQKETHFKKKKTRLLTDTDQQIRKTHTYLQKTKKQLDKIHEGFSDSDKADLIMANLHMFNSGVMELELTSFDGEHTVKVKLKQGQSAAQHQGEQRWYRMHGTVQTGSWEKNAANELLATSCLSKKLQTLPYSKCRPRQKWPSQLNETHALINRL